MSLLTLASLRMTLSLLSPCRMSTLVENSPLHGWGLTRETHTPGWGVVVEEGGRSTHNVIQKHLLRKHLSSRNPHSSNGANIKNWNGTHNLKTLPLIWTHRKVSPDSSPPWFCRQPPMQIRCLSVPTEEEEEEEKMLMRLISWSLHRHTHFVCTLEPKGGVN